ncbi:hypothetical protein CROQUDRAFT_655720 [Cronartium quercuum f. sp. fusiforme G11]|uniref:Uncharacterized protein n=1 Tax=Cronartium quercuum f. sp. fusiforme G11 TaxID=708437 RepID=A0A9P6TEG8_9BASI|nr:hypothetical protein CROQUDRAFT_655720 [Cronartium quercuum f. sp. fusiforme G11]
MAQVGRSVGKSDKLNYTGLLVIALIFIPVRHNRRVFFFLRIIIMMMMMGGNSN